MSTVVIASVVATKARNGGNARAVLSWIQGFQKLGWRTYFVELIPRQACTAADGSPASFHDSVNAVYFQSVMSAAGLTATSSLVCDGGAETCGLGFRDLLDVAESADLLLNVTGHLALEPLMRRLRRKAYLDLDPGYTQFWHESGQEGARLDGHDVFFTIGENIGTSACSIPTGGIAWRHTRQPAVLGEPQHPGSGWSGRFTTVASWRGPYGPVQVGHTTFGLKAHEFRKFIDLPKQASSTFEIALDIHPADASDREALCRNGWRLVDPRQVVPDPDSFDAYVNGSDAEWSVAQGVYVATHCGWFSDRTVRYLTAGKPAVVQDTGFTRSVPVGEGLVAFRTPAEAIAGVRRFERDPQAHAEAARALAERFFDSDHVLGQLLDQAGVVP
jgi:hypothetical protein